MTAGPVRASRGRRLTLNCAIVFFGITMTSRLIGTGAGLVITFRGKPASRRVGGATDARRRPTATFDEQPLHAITPRDRHQRSAGQLSNDFAAHVPGAAEPTAALRADADAVLPLPGGFRQPCSVTLACPKTGWVDRWLSPRRLFTMPSFVRPHDSSPASFRPRRHVRVGDFKLPIGRVFPPSRDGPARPFRARASPDNG